jgi:hypothetical protein
MLENQARIDVGFGSMQPVHMAALLGKKQSLTALLTKGADQDGNREREKILYFFILIHSSFSQLVIQINVLHYTTLHLVATFK